MDELKARVLKFDKDKGKYLSLIKKLDPKRQDADDIICLNDTELKEYIDTETAHAAPAGIVFVCLLVCLFV